ncbi:MAG: rhamnogalacturonan acetylesterase [Tepidisphaeraceae bacterium]
MPRRLSARVVSAVLLALPAAFSYGEDAVTRKFSLGGPAADPSFTTVLPTKTYDVSVGYGFEPGRDIKPIERPAGKGFVTADGSFKFSLHATDGNYRVIVSLGDPDGESDVAIKAESRRIMSPHLHLKKGELTKYEFTVHVRQPQYPGGAVKQIDREKNNPAVLHWDDKLTLEFCGTHPAISAIEVTKVEDATTIFLAGDSTVCDQPGEPWASWGQLLPMYFSPKVAIANYAESGRTFRSFKGENRWNKLFSLVKPGDYVFMQFGHNDMKEKGDGIGPYTSFSDSMREAIRITREKGATPVVFTPMHRRRFEGDKITPTFGDYPDAIRKVANEQGVALIDLQDMSKPLYETFGPDKSKQLFVHYPANTFPNQTTALKDDTHFNVFGANEIARLVIEGMRKAKLPIVSELKPDISAFDPTHPDDPAAFDMPASSPTAVVKPAGS